MQGQWKLTFDRMWAILIRVGVRVNATATSKLVKSLRVGVNLQVVVKIPWLGCQSPVLSAFYAPVPGME